MRDKNGWNLTKKQREKHLETIKLFYAPLRKGYVGIVAPQVCIEDLGLTHEKLKASGREEVTQGLCHGSSPNVSRGTLKPKHRKEWKEQEEIYRWTQLNHLLKGFVMMIGNEGRRTMIQAAVAKRMGLLAGSSDLFIARPAGKYCGLWLEVKQSREYTLSERKKDTWLRQEAFQERMRSVGFAARFAFGAERGIKTIQAYLNLGIREVMCSEPSEVPLDREVE